MSRSNYGKAFAEGRVRYFSPSSILKGDPNAPGGCLRRWFYRYVDQRPEPSSKSQALGTKLHGEQEHYLRTGEDVRSPIARAAARYTPTPGPDLLIEHDIGEGSLELAKLRVAGVPMIGYTDLISPRPAVDADGARLDDPEGTIEGIDWKFVGGWDYIKTTRDLLSDVQLGVYGMWTHKTHARMTHWRASHVYSRTKATPEARKVTALVPLERLTKTWEYVEGVGRSIVDASRAESASCVDANVRACGAFGGCPHAAYCKAGRHDSLASFFGTTGAQEILNPTTKEPKKMALLDMIEDTTSRKAMLQAEMAKLEAEEKAALATDPFAEACAVIEASGRGFPQLGGAAAKARAALTGVSLGERAGLLGVGHLGRLNLTDPAQVLELARELMPTATPAAPPPAIPSAGPVGLLPPDAPESVPPPSVEVVEAQTAKKRGRPRKEATEEVVTAKGQEFLADKPTATQPVEVVTEAARGVYGQAGVVTERTVYVNAVPSCPTTDLRTYAYALAAKLARHCETPDIRMSDAKALDFGKWKGALAAMVRAEPPPAGSYMSIGNDEIERVVATALRDVPGTVYVQGVS